MKIITISFCFLLFVSGCATTTHKTSISSEIKKKQMEEQAYLLIFQAPSIDRFDFGVNLNAAFQNLNGTLLHEYSINDNPYNLDLSTIGFNDLEGNLNVKNGKFTDSVELKGNHNKTPFLSQTTSIFRKDDISAVSIDQFTETEDLWFILINLN